MKKLLCAAGLGIALAVSAGAQAAEKMAVVNMSTIFQQLPQRAAVAKQLENEFKSRQNDLQRQGSDLENKVRRFERNRSTMSASERQKTEKDLMTQRNAFAAKMRAYEQDNHRRQMEESNKILSRIKSGVKTVADSQGYDMVIDANAAVYYNNAKDITADVLKQVK